MDRITVTKLSRISGLCGKTIQKYADQGKLPHRRDANNWRIFEPEALDLAKKLAGVKLDEELRNAEAGSG